MDTINHTSIDDEYRIRLLLENIFPKYILNQKYGDTITNNFKHYYYNQILNNGKLNITSHTGRSNDITKQERETNDTLKIFQKSISKNNNIVLDEKYSLSNNNSNNIKNMVGNNGSEYISTTLIENEIENVHIRTFHNSVTMSDGSSEFPKFKLNDLEKQTIWSSINFNCQGIVSGLNYNVVDDVYLYQIYSYFIVEKGLPRDNIHISNDDLESIKKETTLQQKNWNIEFQQDRNDDDDYSDFKFDYEKIKTRYKLYLKIQNQIASKYNPNKSFKENSYDKTNDFNKLHSKINSNRMDFFKLINFNLPTKFYSFEKDLYIENFKTVINFNENLKKRKFKDLSKNVKQLTTSKNKKLQNFTYIFSDDLFFDPVENLLKHEKSKKNKNTNTKSKSIDKQGENTEKHSDNTSSNDEIHCFANAPLFPNEIDQYYFEVQVFKYTDDSKQITSLGNDIINAKIGFIKTNMFKTKNEEQKSNIEFSNETSEKKPLKDHKTSFQQNDNASLYLKIKKLCESLFSETHLVKNKTKFNEFFTFVYHEYQRKYFKRQFQKVLNDRCSIKKKIFDKYTTSLHDKPKQFVTKSKSKRVSESELESDDFEILQNDEHNGTLGALDKILDLRNNSSFLDENLEKDLKAIVNNILFKSKNYYVSLSINDPLTASTDFKQVNTTSKSLVSQENELTNNINQSLKFPDLKASCRNTLKEQGNYKESEKWSTDGHIKKTENATVGEEEDEDEKDEQEEEEEEEEEEEDEEEEDDEDEEVISESTSSTGRTRPRRKLIRLDNKKRSKINIITSLPLDYKKTYKKKSAKYTKLKSQISHKNWNRKIVSQAKNSNRLVRQPYNTSVWGGPIRVYTVDQRREDRMRLDWTTGVYPDANMTDNEVSRFYGEGMLIDQNRNTSGSENTSNSLPQNVREQSVPELATETGDDGNGNNAFNSIYNNNGSGSTSELGDEESELLNTDSSSDIEEDQEDSDDEDEEVRQILPAWDFRSRLDDALRNYRTKTENDENDKIPLRKKQNFEIATSNLDCRMGDVIGVGIDFVNNQFLITLNGELMGSVDVTDLHSFDSCVPFISLNEKNVGMIVNYGFFNQNFVFDCEKYYLRQKRNLLVKTNNLGVVGVETRNNFFNHNMKNYHPKINSMAQNYFVSKGFNHVSNTFMAEVQRHMRNNSDDQLNLMFGATQTKLLKRNKFQKFSDDLYARIYSLDFSNISTSLVSLSTFILDSFGLQDKDLEIEFSLNVFLFKYFYIEGIRNNNSYMMNKCFTCSKFIYTSFVKNNMGLFFHRWNEICAFYSMELDDANKQLSDFIDNQNIIVELHKEIITRLKSVFNIKSLEKIKTITNEIEYCDISLLELNRNLNGKIENMTANKKLISKDSLKHGKDICTLNELQDMYKISRVLKIDDFLDI